MNLIRILILDVHRIISSLWHLMNFKVYVVSELARERERCALDTLSGSVIYHLLISINARSSESSTFSPCI